MRLPYRKSETGRSIGIDPRYELARSILEAGKIKSMAELFQVVSRTNVSREMGLNYNRFCRAINDPTEFSMKELILMAILFNLPERKLIDMAYEQWQQKTEKKK